MTEPAERESPLGLGAKGIDGSFRRGRGSRTVWQSLGNTLEEAVRLGVVVNGRVGVAGIGPVRGLAGEGPPSLIGFPNASFLAGDGTPTRGLTGR